MFLSGVSRIVKKAGKLTSPFRLGRGWRERLAFIYCIVDLFILHIP